MQEIECVRDEKRTRKFRIISFILSLCLIIGLIPIQIFASNDLTTSNEAIAVIKYFEGFSKYPYWDYSQWTVGYGTRCEGEDLERYKREGISEAEAELLLREFLDDFESSVNKFARKHNLELTQNEFDALVSFSFNCGAGWMSSTSGLLTKAVINDKTGNDFLFAIARWCKAGGEVQSGLIKRRLMEANMYINGVYSVAVAPHFKYVLFDHVESKYNDSTGKYLIQAYDAANTDDVRPIGYKDGYTFLGWYTAQDGGEWIETLDDSLLSEQTLYAHWQESKPVNANYTRITTQELTSYDDPSINSVKARKISKNEKVKIIADYIDLDNNKWGQLEDLTWIQLKNTTSDVKHASVFAAYGKLVTVTGEVNIRKGPGVDYEKIGTALPNEKYLITKVTKIGDSYWGKFEDGWLCLSYTDYKHNPEKPLGTATLKGCKSENVRLLPGGEYQKLATVLEGYKVNVYELGKSSAGTNWARTELGWMSMKYLDYVEGEDTHEPQPEETKPVEPSEPEETTPFEPLPDVEIEIPETRPIIPSEPPVEETEPTPPPVEETKPTEPPVTPTEPPVEEKPPVETQPPKDDNKDEKGSEGIVTASSLRIRSGPGTNYGTVGYLKNGEKVIIYETRKTSSTTWGRMNKGWVCMDYIKITKEEKPEPEYMEGVVIATSLNIRSGPGTSYEVVGYLHNGDKVKISELKNVSGSSWGKTDKGWVSMKYIRVNGSTETKPEFHERTGKVTADLLYVRANAGLSFDRVGSLWHGASVKIKNMKYVDGIPWGQVSNGWISLNHVNLTTPTAGSLAMINADLLNIRNAANGSKIIGQYKRGDVVNIKETKTINGRVWGKTDEGWIDMRYVR